MMKRFPIGILVVFTLTLHAQSRYDRLGVPDTENVWTASEYEATYKVLTGESKRVQLPRYSDRRGKPVLERLVHPSSLQRLRDQEIAVDQRLNEYVTISQVIDDLAVTYAAEVQKKPGAGSEYLSLITFALHLNEVGVELLAEMMPTIQRDGLEELQLARVKQVGRGISKRFVEAELSLSESQRYSPAARLNILKAMEETLPVVQKVIPTETKFDLASKLSGHLTDFGAEGEALISSMLKVLVPPVQ